MPAWSYVVLEDIHALYGGFRIAVTAGNEVWNLVLGGGVPAPGRRYHAKLPQEGFRDLDRILLAHPPRVVPRPRQYLVAGEGEATLTFAAAGAITTVKKAANDRDEEFDAVARFLADASSMIAKRTSPVDEGHWDYARGFLPS